MNFILKDSKGFPYVPCKCKCENPTIEAIAKEIFNDVAAALSKLDNLLCAAILSSYMAILEGEIDAIGGADIEGARAVIQGAKTFAKNGMTAASFFSDWIEPTCGVPDFNFDLASMFTTLIAGPDSMGKSVGCKIPKLYLPRSSIIELPESGWPMITADAFRPLVKADEVIALLRHLPYIRSYEKPDVVPEAHCVDYTNQGMLEQLKGLEADDLWTIKIGMEGVFTYEDTPAQVVECPDEVKLNLSREAITARAEDYEPPEEEAWRSNNPAWAVDDFYELLKDLYRSLTFIPSNSDHVLDSFAGYLEEFDSAYPMSRRIFRAHGWPDLDAYKKEECLEGVQKALRKNYSDFTLPCWSYHSYH
ncbi:hypothetical protein JX265_006977 [Neoarthrinium moseri]|uniref:Uncharacterized protein n=1 Tax=Neoarthrinium moseri TaxID=1658444 RepID=A0A9P9WLH7_9PEZI|nr:uncharacterized protein JN550_010177 [Neoarthrinium moseri]KAI1862652.1 hypothetical protein JN550_010177 [Neoarthrinium moseri]KAI1868998.1 hypothetical protein JX265_006977 [Neoarthrinium moseri]